ncbi:hypothetical protein C8Q75DRAFT_832340 [Abortiporus biennis]|nr:hypothetical protein C8Q75DRAFT_832340 [Abortiporus biennis]
MLLISAFPPMIDAFGGANSTKGNTGPFWVGSGLAVFSALVTLFMIKPLSHDGMLQEDLEFRQYLEENGYDTSLMGIVDDSSSYTSEKIDVDEKEKEPVSA